MINTMSKEIYESQVAKDAAKRFRMLCEYTFNIAEDDGEEEIATPKDTTPGNEDISPAEGDMNDMNGMNDMQTPPAEDGGAPGFNPEVSDDMDMPDVNANLDSNVDTEPMQSEDEVIDIDELTSSQEETEEKVEDLHVTMEKGFEKLLNVVNRLDKMIDMSTANMENIKQEIEKRNPTPIEKLNMRAANDSYPFNIKPDDYWKEKEATSNYRIGGEGESDATQYTITQADIDNITDFKKISQDLDDSGFNQNLMNIFGLR